MTTNWREILLSKTAAPKPMEVCIVYRYMPDHTKWSKRKLAIAARILRPLGLIVSLPVLDWIYEESERLVLRTSQPFVHEGALHIINTNTLQFRPVTRAMAVVRALIYDPDHELPIWDVSLDVTPRHLSVGDQCSFTDGSLHIQIETDHARYGPGYYADLDDAEGF